MLAIIDGYLTCTSIYIARGTTAPAGPRPSRLRPGEGGAAIRGQEERLFGPDFLFATLANLFNAFGMQMLTATLPLYVVEMGGTAADAGLVTGALAFTAMILRPLVGWVADAWRRRPLVLVRTACAALA